MASDEIFRFTNVRPIQKISQDHAEKRFAKYDENKKPPFCVKIISQAFDRSRIIDLAIKQVSENEVIKEKLPLLISVVKTASSTTFADGMNNVGEAKKASEEKLGTSISAYLKSDAAIELRNWLWDSLCAHTVVPGERPDEREQVFEGIRSFFFLEFLSNQKDTDKPLNWSELSEVKPIVPEELTPEFAKQDETLRDSIVKDVAEKLNKVHERVKEINAAINDLQSANRKYLARATTPVVFTVSDTRIEKQQTQAEKKMEVLPKEQRESAANKKELTKTVKIPERRSWAISETRTRFLSANTKKMLESHKDIEGLETSEVVANLKKEKAALVNDFFRNTSQKAIQYVRGSPQYAAVLQDTPVIGLKVLPAAPIILNLTVTPGSAVARGIKPLGIADLLVVKQSLIYYEAGEIAHVHNVMKSEFQTSTNSTLKETEIITTTETEHEEESQKDQQTTDRFELQREAQKTIQDQMSLGAGMSITGSYGLVSVTAHADFALSTSSTESSKSATSIAKEVINKTASRINEKVRRVQTSRALERFEEKHIHGFDNKQGQGHVIGIYRWLDKYYCVNLINYGRRLMMEFIVPEPAAFYRYQKTSQYNKTLSGIRLKEPDKPTASGVDLQPYHLDPDGEGYMELAAKYNAQDVEPPPPATKTVSVSFAESANPPGGNCVFGKSSEKIAIPKGYAVDEVQGSCGFDTSEKLGWCVVWIGTQLVYLQPDWQTIGHFAFCFSNVVGDSFPVSVLGFGNAYDVSVTAHCVRTEEEKQRWQLKTFQSIMNAYERLLAEYYQQLDSMQVSVGVQIQGMNPDINRKIEREELKKGVLRLLTDNFAQTSVGGNWRYNEMFNAMEDDKNGGYPDFNTGEAIVEGRTIQFFEQAFEWENLTYVYYPYFWGRKEQWLSIFPLNDTDPLFTDFLRAGAARVLVPVRSAYTESVLYYLKSNVIWNGGDPPVFNDPLYVSIVDEIKASSNVIDDEELPKYGENCTYPCLVDEWTIKLPTSLVYLQEDATLPNMRKKPPTG